MSRELVEPRERLAFRLDEAAAVISVSPEYFNEHIRPEIRVVRRGRAVLVPKSELEKWLERNAALAIEGQ